MESLDFMAGVRLAAFVPAEDETCRVPLASARADHRNRRKERERERGLGFRVSGFGV